MNNYYGPKAVAWRCGKTYLSVAVSEDGGYDYFVYDLNYHVLDSGIITDTDSPVTVLAGDLMLELGLDIANTRRVDYDELQDKAVAVLADELACSKVFVA